MKTGLVMEGGAMRGMFTVGVLDVLMENGISFDGAIGVSAGAVFGCNIKSKQIGRAIRYNKKYCSDVRYGSTLAWLITGDLYSENFCYGKLAYELDPFDIKTYRENPMEFYAVCTDVLTGKPVYKKLEKGNGKDMAYFRASASMPIVSKPVKVDGKLLLDGGISDSIPLRRMERFGYEKNLVILTQPMDYRKEPAKKMKLMKLALARYPKIARAMEVRHIMYNRELDHVRREEAEGKALVIRPKESLNIGKAEKDPNELERVYQLGREAAEERLEEIKSWFSEEDR